MPKIMSIILLVAVIVVILSALGFYCYVAFFNHNLGKFQPNKALPVKALPDPAKQMELILKNYPEAASGTINFWYKGNELIKTTLKTDAGKIYTLWPFQPQSVYESFGAKNGKKVEVHAKSLINTDRLEWSLMKPL
jgi:hypothetical protein